MPASSRFETHPRPRRAPLPPHAPAANPSVARVSDLFDEAVEAAGTLQRLGRAHVDRAQGGALKVRSGSPQLPAGMGVWGRDRRWDGGRRGGWVVRTTHPRSDDAVLIFVPLAGPPHVREPMGNGNLLPPIGLAAFVERGHRARTLDFGEGLPRRSVVDAEASLRQFIAVAADYLVALRTR